MGIRKSASAKLRSLPSDEQTGSGPQLLLTALALTEIRPTVLVKQSALVFRNDSQFVAKSPMRSLSFVQAQHFRVAPK
jgi:hypothetical protein